MKVAEELIDLIQDTPATKTYKPKKKRAGNKNLADVLMTRPGKEKKNIHMSHFQTNISMNLKHQVDTLYLPEDNEKKIPYKYALVVVDVGTRLLDAEPMAGLESKDAVEAITKIYSRKILKKPEILTCDNGTEFKAAFKVYCEDNDIRLRTAKKYRHRQVALAERANARIVRPLFKRQLEEELRTGHLSRQWISELPKVVKKLNAERKALPLEKEIEEPICTGDDCNMYEQGDKVRIILDAPVNHLDEKRLIGWAFRVGDTRWSKDIHTITKAFLLPGQPPLYCVDDDEQTAYTKGQLLPVNPSHERAPTKSKIRPHKGEDIWLVDRLVDRKTVGRVVKYKVRWKGFDEEDDTYETRASLMKYVPELIEEYENPKPKTKSRKKKTNKKKT